MTNKPKFNREDVTPDIVRELLNYNPVTGMFTWKIRDKRWFNDVGPMKIWNARFSNKSALTYITKNGYNQGNILGILFYAHRVAYAISFREWPIEVDHINGIRTDNRIENLRDVGNRHYNMTNSRMRSDNTSGFVGVHWNKMLQKWTSSIQVRGKSVHLGVFNSYVDAVNCRKLANIRYGFHKNHGTSKQLLRP